METKTERLPAHAGNSKPRKTEAEATLTHPKGRPRRDGNRRFERVRKQRTVKPPQAEQGRTGGGRTETGAKNTTTSTRRSRHQGRECSPRGKQRKNEAGGENLAKENKQKRRKSSTRTTEEPPMENLQHGRQQEACQKRRAAGGAGCGKTGTKTRKNRKSHDRLKRGRETGRDSQKPKLQ